MNDRDRIAEIIRNARMNADPLSQVGYAEADSLLANGVILPPCKVGDVVYCIVKYQSKGFEDRLPERDIIIEEKITRIAQTKMPYLFFDTNTVHFTEDKIGKTAFLTEEEAEEKLKELGK